ncbi:MAG: hypothetical protein AAF989_17270, partial [Planctomycetota bacterium]
CRGVAFRVLAKTDRELAGRFLDSPACDEYVQAIDRWISRYRGDFPDNLRRRRELEEESRWLRR